MRVVLPSIFLFAMYVPPALGAYSAGLSFRSHLDSTSTTTKAVGIEGPASSDARFKIPRLRLDLNGSPTEKVSYRLRLRFDKSADVTGSGQSDIVDFGYVDFKTSLMNVRVGRQYSYHGGVEGNQYLGDIYYTLAEGYKYLINFTGLSLSHEVMEKNTVSLFVGNSLEAEKVAGVANTHQSSLGLVYRGSFSGMIEPSFTYFMIPKEPGQHLKRANSSALSLGLYGAAAGASVGLSFIKIDDKGRLSDDTTATPSELDVTTQSIVLEADYRVEMLRPVVKFESSTVEKTNEKTTYTKIAAVLEYKADKDANLNYYVGYVMNNKEGVVTAESTEVKAEEKKNTILVGAFIDNAIKW